MNAGSVAALFVIANPVFTRRPTSTSPPPCAASGGRSTSASMWTTALACDWHINEAHYSETWGDGRPTTHSQHQPVAHAPIYNGRSAIEVLSYFLSEQADLNPREIVKGHWRRIWPANGGSVGTFESGWQSALRDGVIPNTARPRVNGQPNAANIPPYKAAPPSMEVNFRPDPTLFDGRFANNAWLQEPCRSR